jgi:hypothetical protein
MTIRILVKGIALAVLIILASAHTGAAKFILIIASIGGIVSIFYTLSNYKKLKLEIDVLVIDQLFSGTEKFKLGEIKSWKGASLLSSWSFATKPHSFF